MNVAIVACYTFHDHNYSIIYITVLHLYFSVGENKKSLKKNKSAISNNDIRKALMNLYKHIKLFQAHAVHRV